MLGVGRLIFHKFDGGFVVVKRSRCVVAAEEGAVLETALQNWSVGGLECWSVGVLGGWSVGVLEKCSDAGKIHL